MSKGLQFQSSYNFIKNLSQRGGYAPTGFAGEGGGTLTDPSNPNLDYGNVAYGLTPQGTASRLLSSTIFRSPIPRYAIVKSGWRGGWELAGVLLFQSGAFLQVVGSGIDPSGTNFPNLQGSGRVDVVPGVSPTQLHRVPLAG